MLKKVKLDDASNTGVLKERAALVWQPELSILVGKLLTLIEATVEKERVESVKSILKSTVYEWYGNANMVESESPDSPNFTLVQYSTNHE